jgi:glycosyltransferase involved in cell wall biosynthesis
MRRVLVQVNSLGLGGTGINAVDFASVMVERGYDSLLVAPRDTMPQGPSLFDVARERGVQLETFDRPQRGNGVWDMPRSTRELQRVAARYGSDLIHVYGMGSHRPAYWGPCRFGRQPCVLTVYETAITAATPRRPSLIVGTRYELEEQAGRAGAVVLISPPVDLVRDDRERVSGEGLVRALDLPRDMVRVVMVTRLDAPMKSLAIALTMRAMDHLAATRTQLVVVGTGNEERRLRRLADAINARHGRSVVVLAGAMPDPRPAYAAADIVVGMGNSAARGLAFGKPLIVSGEAGWFRTFTPACADAMFRNNFWSDESDQDPVGELHRSLVSLIGSPESRSELGEFGHRFAREHFGLSAMADRLADVYDEALRGHRRGDWWRDLPIELEYLRQRAQTELRPASRSTTAART